MAGQGPHPEGAAARPEEMAEFSDYFPAPSEPVKARWDGSACSDERGAAEGVLRRMTVRPTGRPRASGLC